MVGNLHKADTLGQINANAAGKVRAGAQGLDARIPGQQVTAFPDGGKQDCAAFIFSRGRYRIGQIFLVPQVGNCLLYTSPSPRNP